MNLSDGKTVVVVRPALRRLSHCLPVSLGQDYGFIAVPFNSWARGAGLGWVHTHTKWAEGKGQKEEKKPALPPPGSHCPSAHFVSVKAFSSFRCTLPPKRVPDHITSLHPLGRCLCSAIFDSVKVFLYLTISCVRAASLRPVPPDSSPCPDLCYLSLFSLFSCFLARLVCLPPLFFTQSSPPASSLIH